jgi:hypothetical protein
MGGETGNVARYAPVVNRGVRERKIWGMRCIIKE